MSLHIILMGGVIYTSKDEVAFFKGAYLRNVFSVNGIAGAVLLRRYMDVFM